MKSCLELHLECLEDRRLLTTLQMFVAGSTGQENFDLRVSGQTVASYTNVSQQQQVFTYETNDRLSANDIAIQFTNDAGFSGPTDRNLIVDKIKLDGVTFQTEHASTFSTGTWRAEDGIVPGNGRGDTLHTNGFFQYSQNGQSFEGSRVAVTARGTTGQELMRVTVNGEELGEFRVSNANILYDLGASGTVNPATDVIRVEYTNDSANTGDLVVDSVLIDGVTLQSEAPTTFSTGSYTATGLTPGYHKTEFLHTSGFFEYNAAAAAPSTITVYARGINPAPQARVTVNGQQVGAALNITNTGTNAPYSVQMDRTFDVNRDVLRVEFLNDGNGPEGNIDLIVDRVEVDGRAFQTEAPTTYSTGTYDANGFSPGFKMSEVLHTNGFFEYLSRAGTTSTIAVLARGTTGTEQMRVTVNGQQVGNVINVTSTTHQTYNVALGRQLSTFNDVVRVEFLNDGTSGGVDRNLIVDRIEDQIAGTGGVALNTYETEAASTFSTGTWTATSNDGFTAGNWQSETLHTNGYFEYFLRPITPAPTSQYNIELVNNGGLTAGQFATFEQAVTFLESIVVGDIGGATDLTLTVMGQAIDGAGDENGNTLAMAGPDTLYANGLAQTGTAIFDTFDLGNLSAQDLLGTAIHEFIHVLGFGTTTQFNNGLITNGAYTGARGILAYRFLNENTATSVPFDAASGHWDETTFTTEGMTPILQGGVPNPFSVLTVAALEDLGYQVNYLNAQTFNGKTGAQFLATLNPQATLQAEPFVTNNVTATITRAGDLRIIGDHGDNGIELQMTAGGDILLTGDHQTQINGQQSVVLDVGPQGLRDLRLVMKGGADSVLINSQGNLLSFRNARAVMGGGSDSFVDDGSQYRGNVNVLLGASNAGNADHNGVQEAHFLDTHVRGNLRVTGGSAADSIGLGGIVALAGYESSTARHITVEGAVVIRTGNGQDDVYVGGQIDEQSAAFSDRIDINLGTGNDNATVAGHRLSYLVAERFRLNGGSGTDHFTSFVASIDGTTDLEGQNFETST